MSSASDAQLTFGSSEPRSDAVWKEHVSPSPTLASQALADSISASQTPEQLDSERERTRQELSG